MNEKITLGGSKEEKKTPLLEELSKSELGLVMEDVKYLMGKGEIIYIIDASDIKDFCYPMGLDPKETQGVDRNTRINQQIAINDMLFNGFTKCYPLVTKEYFKELWNLKNTILRRMELGLEIVNYVEELSKGVDRKKESVSKLIEKNYALIASIKIGVLSKGYNYLVNLSKKSLLKFENAKNSKIAKEILNFRVSDVWDKKVDEEVLEIFDLFDKRSKENQMATMRDATSILLTKSLNGQFNANKKYCYLSSQRKSKILFENNPELKSAVNFRTSAHLFALNTARRYQNDGKKVDLDATLKVLQHLYESFFNIEWGNINTSATSGISSQVTSYLDNYENWGVLAQDKLNEFNQAHTEVFQRYYGKETQEIVINFLEYFHDNQNFNKIAEFKQNSSLFLIDTFDEIIKFLNEDIPELYARGNDPIEAKSQILPVCYMESEYDSDFSELLTGLSRAILGEGNDWKNLKAKIIWFLESGKTKSLPDPNFLLLCSVLTLLLKNDEESIKELVRDISSYILIQKKVSSNIKNEFTKTIEVFEVELEYVACWALRRARLYEKSLAIADKSIKNKDRKGDPRFYHGYFLTLYSIWHDKRKGKDVGSYKDDTTGLDEIIVYGMNSYKLYEKASNRFSEVNRCLEALENSLAYLYAFKAKKQSGEEQLESNKEAEKYLRKLKTRIFETDWIKYPEYMHTEALLRLSQARYFKNQDKQEEFNEAIQTCLTLLRNTIRFCKKNSRKRLLKRSIRMEKNVLSEFFDDSK